MNKTYTISIIELLDRPIIRNDQQYEWMNKMTDEELDNWQKESIEIIKDTTENYEVYNGNWMLDLISKHIDRDILYRIMKMDEGKYRKYV
jgi:hypothetical protein